MPLLMDTGIDDIKIWSGIYAADKTRAYLWDVNGRGDHREALDDAGLRNELAKLGSFWNSSEIPKSSLPTTNRKFVLVGTVGDPVKSHRQMQLRRETFDYLTRGAGFNASIVQDFFTNILPATSYNFEYDQNDEKPSYMTSLDCFTFLTGAFAEDVSRILSHCANDKAALRAHPLFFLTMVYQNRSDAWMTWTARVWNQVLEIETATNMTHPRWKARQQIEEHRLKSLSTVDTLLNQLHAMHVELCHARTVTAFAFRFAEAISEIADEINKKRQDLGLTPMSMQQKSDFEYRVRHITARLTSMSDRVTELRDRLNGQINVSYNLIAQKDSKVNFAIAQLQSYDSRTIKGIAILTLLFLPTTLISTLWTTNLFRLNGNLNWQVYLTASLVLTLLVFAGWAVYVRISRDRDDARWAGFAVNDLGIYSSEELAAHDMEHTLTFTHDKPHLSV
ncbi:hypothetical protein S7711_01803 [Stachybotrys chartarum IBT 7711]|uniref:Uncharacterized protein n=1 Tax=Stachybotrys chartarum (strain CBS 109288 / IBT 7711) TaxID=1280523 RepID=A0A084AJ06_STACB|nr:hypothetical protein S7711_01803 [Stachybotrys chartarum IBT 7711]KFA71828.1 hypothetical protein S40288_07935 [Stachybotrys chartarum IBT 40288]